MIFTWKTFQRIRYGGRTNRPTNRPSLQQPDGHTLISRCELRLDEQKDWATGKASDADGRALEPVVKAFEPAEISEGDKKIISNGAAADLKQHENADIVKKCGLLKVE